MCSMDEKLTVDTVPGVSVMSDGGLSQNPELNGLRELKEEEIGKRGNEDRI